ncbi:MAG TPA: ATP-binding protein [Granulicella sp.]|jgi:heavy metal sensor kinase|nr:ATP-binding protein [Granulicella sp.]
MTVSIPMTVSIRIRLTLWYAALVSIILALLGLGVFLGASWGLRKAADQELTSGVDGVAAFLQHKLIMQEMNNLNEELREHSALLPRGKMLRVSRADHSIVYQTDAMTAITSVTPASSEMLKQTVEVSERSFRTISRITRVGPYTFLIELAVDQTEYQELLMGLAWLLLLSIPIAGLLAAIAGHWMSGRALSPIHQITETANSIDARSLSRRLPLLGTGDELDRLSSTINHMLDRIATSYDRIAQFTADASHELRTPVALIQSNAELMLMEPTDAARIERGLSDILAESDYMARLIADLLTLARSGVEDSAICMELFELGQSVSAILPRARSQAMARGVTVEFMPHDRIVPMEGSQRIVERVLMIFIDNALRYTPTGGKISIATWSSDQCCGFTVRDTGIGIAPADQERIFERFFRVDTARTHGDGGSGLGLSIAKSLIEMHRGTIHVDSAIGCGASFEVAFPRADIQCLADEIQIVP